MKTATRRITAAGIGTAMVGAAALSAGVAVHVDSAASATACQAALFHIKAGMPGAGAAYPAAKVAAECSGGDLKVTSNGIPSYTFVKKTPNALRAQDWSWTIPLAPARASRATSIVNRLGTLGFTVTGIPIYGPTEGPQPANEAYGDPVYNKILDSCKGHTGFTGEYHDHAIAATAACGFEGGTVIGYAIDGFPILAPSSNAKSGYVRVGNPSSQSWKAYTYRPSRNRKVLDKCNGRTEADGTYAYHATTSFPYFIGCFRGTPVTQQGVAGGPMPPMGPPPR